MRRHRQIERCRHALINAAGEIEFRAVAGAKKSALPFRAEIRRCNFGTILGRTAQVRADAYQHQDVVTYRTMIVAGIGRLLRLLRIRIAQLVASVQSRNRRSSGAVRFTT